MNSILVRSLATAALLVTVSCHAASPVAAFLACSPIRQAAARLACFDREAAGTRAAASGAAAAHGSTSAAAALDPRLTFGLAAATIDAREVSAGVRQRALMRESARITNLSESADGRLIFALDNRQVWMEILQDHDLLADIGQTAIITQQLFGSYWMQLQSGRGCKVTRIH